MLNATIEIIKSGLKSDSTLTAQDRQRIVAAIREATSPKIQPIIYLESRLARRAEVAQRLQCSLRTVDKLAASGVLSKRKLPGRMRASGFLASDVELLITAGGNYHNQ